MSTVVLSATITIVAGVEGSWLAENVANNTVRLRSSGGARDGDAITRAVVLPQTLLICGHDDRPESEDGHPESN
jgi:hypothetical protein